MKTTRISSTIAALIATLSMCVSIVHGELFMMDDLDIHIPSESYRSSPPITLKRIGDYLVLQCRIENDARDQELRKREIATTLQGMISTALQSKRFEIHNGEMVLTAESSTIALHEDTKRADSSYGELFVKVPLKADDDIPRLTEELGDFVATAKMDGRTTLIAGKIGLSIQNPEQYRYELIEAIAADIARISELFGNSYQFDISGLDQSLNIKRVGIGEVELFLRYSFSMRSKQQ